VAGVQLPLNMPLRAARARADLIVAPCNAEAVAWIDRWPDWPARELILYGPPASGKTHLVEVFLARTGGVLLPSSFSPSDVPALIDAAPTFAVDGADSLSGAAERAFLHLLNWARERKISGLLTGTLSPAQWVIQLPDLGSRLRALPAVGIGAPDDFLLKAVLLKLFADRQLRVDDAVLSYMLARMERSFRVAGILAAELDRVALAQMRPVTVPLAKMVLAALEARKDVV
jgi:chromosomal replication initiation ATPase DnaA